MNENGLLTREAAEMEGGRPAIFMLAGCLNKRKDPASLKSGLSYSNGIGNQAQIFAK